MFIMEKQEPNTKKVQSQSDVKEIADYTPEQMMEMRKQIMDNYEEEIQLLELQARHSLLLAEIEETKLRKLKAMGDYSYLYEVLTRAKTTKTPTKPVEEEKGPEPITKEAGVNETVFAKRTLKTD